MGHDRNKQYSIQPLENPPRCCATVDERRFILAESRVGKAAGVEVPPLVLALPLLGIREGGDWLVERAGRIDGGGAGRHVALHQPHPIREMAGALPS